MKGRDGKVVLKRLLDIVGALVLLAVAWPFMIFAAILISRTLGEGGILFRQTRPGLFEKPFVLVKFRSLLESFDESGEILPEGQRLTRSGWFLRKFSIDELPQLWNVLKGEMSLVGPRPLLTEYLSTLGPEFRRRHDVKPGITGWAQVTGRHDLVFSERLRRDVWYVDNRSLALDLRILWLTVLQLLRPRNVARPDQPASEVDDLGLQATIEPRRRPDDQS